MLAMTGIVALLVASVAPQTFGTAFAAGPVIDEPASTRPGGTPRPARATIDGGFRAGLPSGVIVARFEDDDDGNDNDGADETGRAEVVGAESDGSAAGECAPGVEHPCPITPAAPVSAAFSRPSEVHAYRLFALAPGGRVRVDLEDAPVGTRVRLLGWAARLLAEAAVDAAGTTRLEAEAKVAGAYVVEVIAPEELAEAPYRLALGMTYSEPAPRAVALVPPSVESTASGAMADGRYTLRTPRGGSPDAGLALSRGLRTSPETDLADFALVADVRFDQIGGPAAATVRFRYQREDGGGTGYVVSVDPVRGQVALDTFDEGQRTTLVPPTTHPLAKVERGAFRLGIRAVGPSLSVSIDGQEVASIMDERYATGLVALGVVTWSDPVWATFDNVLVTIPASDSAE